MREGILWQATTYSELERWWGMKGEVMVVSQGQRKGRMEKNRVQKCEPSHISQSSGEYLAFRGKPCERASAPPDALGSALPSLPCWSSTALVTAAEREAARGARARGLCRVP